MARWKNLPDVIFSDIMMMIGLNSFEDLHRCRQVSQSWNVMISEMTKYKKVTIRKKAEILVSRISFSSYESFSKIVTAARLAHHGLHGSVYRVYLCDMDLASVPAEHLASLSSCVTRSVDITNVSNCDLTSILDSVKCDMLSISSQTLSIEETQALVRAMESRVKWVRLGEEGEVSLDIIALTQYNGQGKCRMVNYTEYNDTADRYREVVRSWVEKINWRVTGGSGLVKISHYTFKCVSTHFKSFK